MKYRVIVDGAEHIVDVQAESAAFDGRLHEVQLRETGRPWLFSLLIDGRAHDVACSDGEVQVDGQAYAIDVERDLGLPRGAGRAGRAGAGQLKAPIPGLVIAVHVKPGDEVQEGQALVVLEAMKMQMELKSPRAGKVSEVHATPGQEANQGQLLAVIAG